VIYLYLDRLNNRLGRAGNAAPEHAAAAEGSAG
jgi:hypothetical protein